MKGQHSARHSDQQNPVTEPCLPTWTHSTSPTSHSHGDILHGQKEKESGHNAMHCFSQSIVPMSTVQDNTGCSQLNKAEPMTDKQQESNMSSPNTKSFTEKCYLFSQEAMVKQHPHTGRSGGHDSKNKEQPLPPDDKEQPHPHQQPIPHPNGHHEHQDSLHLRDKNS